MLAATSVATHLMTLADFSAVSMMPISSIGGAAWGLFFVEIQKKLSSERKEKLQDR